MLESSLDGLYYPLPMILLPSFSPVSVQGDLCRIDRKFHTGTSLYAEALHEPILCLAPELGPEQGGFEMDHVDLDRGDLAYRVEAIRCDVNFLPLREEIPRIEGYVRESRLVYGRALGAARAARSFGVPYVAIAERSLGTNLSIARLESPNLLRRAARQLETLLAFPVEMAELARAQAVHCNGYPSYHESRRLNSRCLLFFDSRTDREEVIPAARLDSRLRELEGGRRPRVLYSGRFIPIKGVLETVEVGVELMRLGVDFELHLYGKGELRQAMIDRIARSHAEANIFVHDAVPFPELVEIASKSDLFLCCHLQGDPSCTYIESLAAGLPIVGFGNAMWRALARDSGAGVSVPIGNRREAARAAAALLADRDDLRTRSMRAREFAYAHCFENEFAKRVDDLRAILA